ncbi:acyl-CoA dehydrogenase family protein [Saccharothrix obliqua]|uniref:acyl-CoA dehydrogenase family protein n=1 Tax=Saccharothrix obliqua TaxID=2861747 RepID=UPI001C5E3D03|nr:acyl-CoA dehydrogenase family protein [Saccharothrix obliqua]MBW4720405.1 acyl-CoA dehydrogenase family protein [Saccharothrix obliqua]
MITEVPLDADQRAYRDVVARFAEEELDPGAPEREAEGRFDRELWRRCARVGLQGLPIPVEYGGGGADPVTLVAALEALGHGCRDNGLIFSLNAHLWACALPVLACGTEEQRKRYLPGLCDGTLIGLQAMTEPDTGSDAMGMAATARRVSGGWVLDGVKTLVTNAPVADLFVVFARTDPDAGFFGTSAFLVERDAPGLLVGPPMAKMGLRTSPTAQVELRGCLVGEDALLGAEGGGGRVFATAMEWERGFVLASALGTMRRHLEAAVEHARQRRQFDRPIAAFQAVSHRIVDMHVRLETARAVQYRYAQQCARGGSSAASAALVKLHLSECLVRSAMDVMEVFGGHGYLSGTGLEREVRDALASRAYSGTSDVLRMLIARELGL